MIPRASLLLVLASPFFVASFSVAPLHPLLPRHLITSTTTTTTTLFSAALEEVESMRAGAIKKELESYGISTRSFLEKSELVDALKAARAQGKQPVRPQEKTTTSSSSTSSETSSQDKRPRAERLAEELENCARMRNSELKQELTALGISTKAFMEKKEFVEALANARVDGTKKKKASSDGYAEYANVEVITDASSGPRQKQSQQPQQRQGSPFGGGAGGGNPFGGGAGGGNPFGGGGMGGMGGMGNIADMLKNFGGGGGGGNPFGGGGGNPFGGGGMGGMGDAMGKAQQMMNNPKVRDILQKAQGNPNIMKKVNECMSNPASFAKYQNDPEVSELISELKKYM